MLNRATGIGLAVAVLATGGLATAAVARSQSDDDRSPVAGSGTPTTQPTVSTVQPKVGTVQPKVIDTVPALEAAQVKYQSQHWGDPKTEVGMVILAPKGWKMAKLSTFEVKFTSSNGKWNLRVNGSPKAQPIKTAADGKYALTSASLADFKLISRETGSTRATHRAFAGSVFHHQTLTYTYTDPVRGQRLVVDRFVSLDDMRHTLFELSTGGRPQDAGALAAITAKATEDFIRAP